MAVLLPVGTRKGLFLLRSDGDRKDWELEGPLLPGWPVYHAIVDPRDGVLYAATNSFIYGGTVHRSRDLGRTWERAEEIGLPEESGLKLNATWHVEPGNGSELWDGGDSWTPINKDVAADFHPEKYPEVGQCVHKLLAHPTRPDRLWQQNHCGVYRSDDRGDNWERLDGNGLPSDFGFALALDAEDPDVAYVIPEVSGEQHFTPDGRLGVYRTADGGDSWQLTSNGLPDRAWAAVLREGFAYDDAGLYFGTQSGSVWSAPRGGSEWIEAAGNLPPILS